MSAITCSSGTDKCNTIANCLLPTEIPASNFTGLAAVNVNNAQDWRVYYSDEDGYISELQGDNSGFNSGKPIVCFGGAHFLLSQNVLFSSRNIPESAIANFLVTQGGSALNASSIAAVNVNSVTNNINVFYIDQLTQALFKMQFTAGFWTKRKLYRYVSYQETH